MKNIFTSLLLFFSIILTPSISKADEGMWIPMLLEQLNMSDMTSMGLKLKAEDIYSINKSSLKDAVVLFGGGCTAELISNKGLILTNHHCGFGSIQSHSSVENNYLKNGFWAMQQSDEMSNPGLSVTFLVRMEDVTTKVLEGINDKMTEATRETAIAKNIEKIEKSSIKDTHYKAKIKPFFCGNEYYLFITEVFTDIRLVGAPPEDIGKFGGDTDNWMWPRQTGDFSIFRIYANKNNEPADYSIDNVPYTPKKSLTISIKGVKKNDFTMVYGFPGSTEQFLTSYGVKMIMETENPIGISLREKKLSILSTDMASSDLLHIQYADKYAGVANYWKKWIGENKGLKKLDAINKKRIQESLFTAWVESNPERTKKYGELLKTFEKTYSKLTNYTLSWRYFAEAGTGVEIVKYAWGWNTLISKCLDPNSKPEDIQKIIEKFSKSAKNYFKNYNAPTDKKVFIALLKMYYNGLNKTLHPEIFKTIETKYKGDFSLYADFIFEKSIFTSEEKVNKFLASFKTSSFSKIEKDPAFQLASSIYNNYYDKVMPQLTILNDEIDSLSRIYVKALKEMSPNKRFYPDANLTLRLAYGKVADYQPMDGVNYDYFTTLDGMIQKEDPNVDDYKVPQKLKELYKNKDYGRYAENGKMHIAFIATNHTTGGNSGSPVFNAEGQLIGTNFDRVWEGTMSDIMYDPNQCRNITLDIRYTLFIIDKFAGAKRLIDEMDIVN
ncbi:MAG: S46 family peptidase [Bacteroidetes bacterium]|nr:S46 family peptidase [Bacteroidota bacterium]